MLLQIISLLMCVYELLCVCVLSVDLGITLHSDDLMLKTFGREASDSRKRHTDSHTRHTAPAVLRSKAHRLTCWESPLPPMKLHSLPPSAVKATRPSSSASPCTSITTTTSSSSRRGSAATTHRRQQTATAALGLNPPTE